MKIHEKSLTCLAIIFTLILVTSAGAYLVYRAWDYWSADQTYADIGRNAVQKVKVKGSPNRDNEALTSKKSTPGSDEYGQNDGTAESYDADKSRHDSTDESSEPEIIDGITTPDKPAIDWDELTKSGKDIVAWLDIPVLGIAYPVVQGDDNEFYLHHLPNGEYKNAGSLFMEAANSPNLTDINTVIYGHNMDNGSMFGKFRNLTGEDYEKQPFLWLCTREKTGLYKMISLHISRVDDESYTLFEPDEAASGEGLLEHAHRTVFEWIHGENRRSYINMTIPRSAFSRVVTFSTCASYSDERRVLQAILVREYDRRTDT